MKKQIHWLAVLLFAAGAATESHAQYGVKYPYVTSAGSTSGKTSVIVSRDNQGGVKTSCIHANWKASAMPTHYEQDAANAVSARFEVASADLSEKKNWADAKSGCASYTQTGTSAGDWRLPTQRELMLMWVMKSQGRLTGLSWAGDYYWASTEDNSAKIDAWYVDFSDGYTFSMGKINNSRYVRCVRDF